ncbi:helix-turn-helix transcriptional regulator [Streptococcaceae bacterium ESL0729]|nr:helix-turn-helix transcriptional regulator [Streptococcaceae bacterium ESL0729]
MKNKTTIAQLRKGQGLTQEALAEKSGLSIRTIQRLEGGDDASLETLKSVARALDVEIIDLFEQDEGQNKNQELEEYSQNFSKQMLQREGEDKLFDILKLLLFVLMLGLGASLSFINNNLLQIFSALFWLFAFLALWPLLKYIRLSLWQPRLDRKYPLTVGHYKSSKQAKSDKFLWWKDDIARPIMLIFWGIITPLIWTLAYVFHLF